MTEALDFVNLEDTQEQLQEVEQSMNLNSNSEDSNVEMQPDQESQISEEVSLQQNQSIAEEKQELEIETSQSQLTDSAAAVACEQQEQMLEKQQDQEVDFESGNIIGQEIPSATTTEWIKQCEHHLTVNIADTFIKNDQLGNLNEGGIITLDQSAQLTCKIYLNEQFVGIGELIDISGKLGLKIIKNNSPSES